MLRRYLLDQLPPDKPMGLIQDKHAELVIDHGVDAVVVLRISFDDDLDLGDDPRPHLWLGGFDTRSVLIAGTQRTSRSR